MFEKLGKDILIGHLDGSNQMKELNVTIVNLLEEGNKCHHGQQIGIFLPRNITFHATPLASNATMFNTWITTYKTKEKDEHH